MKKKKIELNKKLTLNKETVSNLQQQLEQVKGGISGKGCVPMSGTGCGCGVQTCGIIVCTAAGCEIGVEM